MDKTTLKRTSRLSVAVGTILSLALLLGAAWDWWQARQPPSATPHVQGAVEQVSKADGRTRSTVLSPSSGRCVVIVRPDTRIHSPNGAREIEVGQNVKVWHTGEVYETYPPQVYATWIIIETDGPQAQP